MSPYLHQLRQWPDFHWDSRAIEGLLSETRFNQGRLIGQMNALGFELQKEASLNSLTEEVIKSSEIEGEVLDQKQVRSSIARRLGIDMPDLIPSDRQVDGIVEMMIDATNKFRDDLSDERLFAWHAAMFPTGRSGLQKITVGAWRKNPKDDPMVVLSGPIGKETVHFQAPDSDLVPDEMQAFIKWFNSETTTDSLIKAALAHLWFVTIHPFDDGNGRVARAITEMQLARADGTHQRFYSMSSQIRKERNGYYEILEKTQKRNLDVTEWIQWFLTCLGRAIDTSQNTLSEVKHKSRFWEQYHTVTLNERQKLMINKMLDGFEGKLTSTKWALLTKTSSDTALRDILDLINKGILIKVGESKKGASYDLTKWKQGSLNG